MRSNPPQIIIEHLTAEERKKVIALALLVVWDLAKDNLFSAYERIKFSGVETDETLYSALWSLFSSDQRSTLKDTSQIYHKQ